MPDRTDTYDLVISGGGMVGAALACALGERGFRIALIELQPPRRDWPEDEVDLRVSALTRASQRQLQNLGVWDRMCAMRVSPYHRMEVWDAGGPGRIVFDAADVGEPDLGHIVENRVTQWALWEQLQRLENITFYTPDAVVDFISGEQGCCVQLESGISLRSHLVVGAEGANSPIRDRAGITSSGWAYDQHAIVATVWPEQHSQETARQRFMANGPLALLPIDDGRCSIVWSTSPEQATQLMELDDDEFCQALTHASEFCLGVIRRVGPRGRFPLRLRNADQYVKPGLALVGDAAHGIHPLAGQGVNLGFLDASTLVDTLVEAQAADRPLGSMKTLRRYERARRGPNIAMLGAMDLFKRLFSNQNRPLGILRGFGMGLADVSGPVKVMLMRRALGLSGELPTLARRGFGS